MLGARLRTVSRFRGGGGKHGHAQRGLCVPGQANRPSEDIGAKLAPVAAASRIAGEGQNPRPENVVKVLRGFLQFISLFFSLL